MKSDHLVSLRLFIIILVLLILAPLFLHEYTVTLLSQALIFGILAMSLDILVGFTGLPSLGHAAFMGIGAYSVAILSVEHTVGFWGCLVGALLLSAVVAAVFGLIALRATAVYFLMITLALAMIVWGVAYRWYRLTRGDNGITGIVRPDLGLPWSLWSEVNYFYFVLFFFVLAYVLLYLLMRSPFGYTLVGIRDSDSRMQAMGYNTWLHKYIAYVVAGTFGGLSGALWAYFNGFVSPPDIELAISIEALLMVLLGGAASLIGPFIGACVVVFMKQYLSIYVGRWLMILGATYIITVLYLPQGINGGLEDLLGVSTSKGILGRFNLKNLFHREKSTT